MSDFELEFVDCTEAGVLRARDAAEKNYLGRGGVVGVSAGSKFVSGRPTEKACIQFFVIRKLKQVRRAKPIPEYVYGRKRNGSVDRTVRIATDVIEVGETKFVCGGGSKVRAPGEYGTVTLIFNNKMEDNPKRYLLTCAHVAGTVRRSPPINPRLKSRCLPGPELKAITVKNTVQKRGVVEYDIALAEVDPGFPHTADGLIVRDQIRLTDYIPPNRVRPGLRLRMMTAKSKRVDGELHSFVGTQRVRLDGYVYRVKNLFMINARVQGGDSGGIVFHRRSQTAVGIVVAVSSRGHTWFQPLEGAVRHLANMRPRFELEIF